MSSKKNQDGDERFLRVQKDPRFWEMPEREHKIKIDKRFQSMFHDKRFKEKYTVDKRGRPINQTSTEDLKRFYKVSDSEEEEEDVKNKTKTVKKKLVKGKGAARSERDEDDEEEQQSTEEEDDGDEGDGATESEEGESDLESEDSDSEPDLARGRGNVETSSDDDDEEVDDILRREEEEIEHDWGELCKDAPRSEEVSARLAVCNMDWDRMKAKDLLALLNSFSPKGGAVLSVKIYPSEFGKERLQLEETRGPEELRALPDDSEDDTEEERVYREKMRDYQFKRLKYFYAVVECDSAPTATKIYEECDGYEYESSCSVLDLRFIPDDVTFGEEPKDVAADVNLAAYTPKLFTSSATTTSKVQLTWDETDHERVTAMNRKFNKNDLLDMDFHAYLASSSEDEEGGGELGEGANGEDDGGRGGKPSVKEVEQKPQEEEKKKKKKKKKGEEQISKYRELLRGIQDREKKLQEDKDMEMEITWVPGLKEATEQLVKKKLEGRDERTPWEDFLEKKKDRKKQKKSQRKQGEKLERLSDDELPADVDLSEPFFAEELAATDMKKKQKKEKEEELTAEEEELEKRKAEMALLMEDDGEHKHFNYNKIVEQQNLSKGKRKRLLKKGAEPLDDHFQMDVRDPRFQAMFTSPLFSLDPSHPSYKNTRATQSILSETRRQRDLRRQGQDAAVGQEATGRTPGRDFEAVPKTSMDPGLSLLVKSIKTRTQQFQARKKQKVS